MPAHLLSLADGPSILIDKPILLFGRHEECDVQLNSKKVSRRHCVLAQANDYFVIRDLGSTNGVRINGERVAEGKLRPGDELQIGNFKYQVCGDLLGRFCGNGFLGIFAHATPLKDPGGKKQRAEPTGTPVRPLQWG